jgi:hypothetical protein
MSYYGYLPTCKRQCGRSTANAAGICRHCLDGDRKIEMALNNPQSGESFSDYFRVTIARRTDHEDR